MNTINWKQIYKLIEIDLSKKLKNLPSHKVIPERLKEYRSIISHEIPETAPKKIYDEMISNLLMKKDMDVNKVRKNILNPLLKNELEILNKNSFYFLKLRKDAKKWIDNNLSEEKLQKLWKEHKTWLPRRYTIYKKPDTSFQKIAADTLARFIIIKGDKI